MKDVGVVAEKKRSKTKLKQHIKRTVQHTEKRTSGILQTGQLTFVFVYTNTEETLEIKPLSPGQT